MISQLTVDSHRPVPGLSEIDAPTRGRPLRTPAPARAGPLKIKQTRFLDDFGPIDPEIETISHSRACVRVAGRAGDWVEGHRWARQVGWGAGGCQPAAKAELLQIHPGGPDRGAPPVPSRHPHLLEFAQGCALALLRYVHHLFKQHEPLYSTLASQVTCSSARIRQTSARLLESKRCSYL